MPNLSSSRCVSVLFLLNIYYLRLLHADLQDSFSFKNFCQGTNFESRVALYGDAKVVNGGVSLQISGSVASSAGRVVYKRPFELVAGQRKMVSFSMFFVFSMSKENGDGLAFMMVPVGFPLEVFDGGSFGLLSERKYEILLIEFDTFKYGDMNNNHVGIDIGSLISVKSSNVSALKLGLKSAEKLQAWIDYEAGSKRLEVRLSSLGANRPVNPLLSCPIDLSQMWKDEEVLVGLSASSGNSTQVCKIYSWSFELRTSPQWIHSEPLDPNANSDKREEDRNVSNKRSDCGLRLLAALIFGTGCGALGAFIVLLVWTILGNRRPVAPEDCVLPSKAIDCKTPEIVVDNTTKDGMKK